MKITRVRKSKRGRIEIIPMIDVMFFLLATFMLASLSMQRVNALSVSLPQGKAESSSVEKKVSLTIDKNNLLYLNKQKISAENLEPKLHDLLSSGYDDNVVIYADKSSSHGAVTEAMIKAKQAGAKHFSIMTSNQ